VLDAAGVGIRHALGTGSRDLSNEVGGLSTIQALQALDRDPGTEVIIVVSKPPAPAVAARVAAAAAACATPTVTCFIGQDTLEHGAAGALAILQRPVAVPLIREGRTGSRAGEIRGLFSGGTLRDEARTVVAAELGVAGDDLVMIDLGDDTYTRGRPHPMIDQRLLIEHIGRAAADPAVGVLLLDVVLGYGAHPDPAAALAPAVSDTVAAGATVVVSLCGTASDPQDRDRTAGSLNQAGAFVLLSNAAAARRAAELAAS
jgi:FdrA protein